MWNQDTKTSDTCKKNNEPDCDKAGSSKTMYEIAPGASRSLVISTDPATVVTATVCEVGTAAECLELGEMSQDTTAPDVIGRIGAGLTVSDGIMPSSAIQARIVSHVGTGSTSPKIGEWAGVSFDVDVPDGPAGYGKFSLLDFTVPKSNINGNDQIIDYQILRGGDKAYTLCCSENGAIEENGIDATRCSGDLGSCAPLGTITACTTSPEIKWVTVNGVDSFGTTAADSELRCRAGNTVKLWIGCTGALVRTADCLADAGCSRQSNHPLAKDSDWHEQDPPTIQHGASIKTAESASCRPDYHVQPLTAYTWKVIARNAKSVMCKPLEVAGNRGACNSGGDVSTTQAFGWFSAEASHTQSTATPDQPTSLTLSDATTDPLSAQYNVLNTLLSATLHLKWNDPAVTGGLAITQTRVWCTDQTEVDGVQTSGYGNDGAGRNSWTQDAVKNDNSLSMAACDPMPADFDHCVKMAGLKAGTRYWCTASAANPNGGLDEAEYFAWAAVGNTLDSFPSYISGSNGHQALYEADSYFSEARTSIIGQQGGAPVSTDPHLGLRFRCKTPRPNAVSLNDVGPTHCMPHRARTPH